MCHLTWQGLHTDFACLLFKNLMNKPSEATIVAIVAEAVAIEKEVTHFIICVK